MAPRETKLSVAAGSFGRLTVRFAQRPKPIRLHVHSDLHLLMNVSGGELFMQVQGRSHRLRPGEQMFVNRWQLHGPLGGEATSHLTLSFQVDQEWACRARAQGGHADLATPFPNEPQAVDAATYELSQSVAQSWLSVGSMPLAELERNTSELAMRLATAGPRVASRSTASVDTRVRRALEYLQITQSEPANMDELARKVGLSRSHLFRSFKSGLGCPPRYVADAARVKFAIGALGQPRLPVSEIADTLGFSTPGHFTHFFSAHLGVPPGEYRRKLMLLPSHI